MNKTRQTLKELLIVVAGLLIGVGGTGYFLTGTSILLSLFIAGIAVATLYSGSMLYDRYACKTQVAAKQRQEAAVERALEAEHSGSETEYANAMIGVGLNGNGPTIKKVLFLAAKLGFLYTATWYIGKLALYLVTEHMFVLLVIQTTSIMAGVLLVALWQVEKLWRRGRT